MSYKKVVPTTEKALSPRSASALASLLRAYDGLAASLADDARDGRDARLGEEIYEAVARGFLSTGLFVRDANGEIEEVAIPVSVAYRLGA